MPTRLGLAKPRSVAESTRLRQTAAIVPAVAHRDCLFETGVDRLTRPRDTWLPDS
jgi:hypothetical protein